MKRFVFGISFFSFFLLQMIGCNNPPIRCELFDLKKLPVGFNLPDTMVFQSDSLKLTFHKIDSTLRNPDTLCYNSVFTDCSCKSYMLIKYMDEMGVLYLFEYTQDKENLNDFTIFSNPNSIDTTITLPGNANDYIDDIVVKPPKNSKLKNLKFDKNLNWIEFQDSTEKIWRRVNVEFNKFQS